MIEDGLRKLLLADATVSGLIGTHLYPVDIPEDCNVTSAAYRRISTVNQYTLDGPTGLVQIRMQFDALSPRYAAAKALEAAFDAVMEINSPITLPNGVTVHLSQRDGGGGDDFRSGSRLYATSADYLVLYSLP